MRLLVLFGLLSTSTNTDKNKEGNQEIRNDYRRNAKSNHHTVKQIKYNVIKQYAMK